MYRCFTCWPKLLCFLKLSVTLFWENNLLWNVNTDSWSLQLRLLFKKKTCILRILTVQILFHAVFRTLGNLDWLVNKLIFHSSGMFYSNSFNRNIFPFTFIITVKTQWQKQDNDWYYTTIFEQFLELTNGYPQCIT